jgi:hypothetical protein
MPLINDNFKAFRTVSPLSIAKEAIRQMLQSLAKPASPASVVVVLAHQVVSERCQ